MRYLQIILLNMVIPFCVCQSPQDNFIPISNLVAFTHPQFFFSKDCECSRFNSEFLLFEIYKSPNDSTFPYMKADANILSILPPNYDSGYGVIITGKDDDFFRIEFKDIDPICPECTIHLYYVKKGTLGTWIANINDSTGEYNPVPLYEDPATDSKIITKLKPEDSVLLILDVNEKWMLVETISKGKKKRGWLDPKMQFGNPYGAF